MSVPVFTETAEIEFNTDETKARIKFSDGTFSEYCNSKHSLSEEIYKAISDKKIIPDGKIHLTFKSVLDSKPDFPEIIVKSFANC